MKDHARRIGYLAFFVSGICAISSSVIVSLLQESRGFNYSVSGTLLSVMNIGNLAAGCVVFYIGLVLSHSQTPAVLLLLGFSVSIAGMNSTIVSCAGKMTSAASLGIMLPTAGLGAILMPGVIGLIAQFAGLRVGMAANVLPCAGMLALAAVMEKRDLYRGSMRSKHQT